MSDSLHDVEPVDAHLNVSEYRVESASSIVSTGGAYLIVGLIAEVWITYRFAELWITVVVALVGFFAIASLLYGIHQYLKEKLVRIDFDNETITLVNCRGSNPIWSFFAKSVAELRFKEVIRVQRLSGLGTSNPRLLTQQGTFVLGIYLENGGGDVGKFVQHCAR